MKNDNNEISWPKGIAFYLGMPKTRCNSSNDPVNVAPITVEESFVDSLADIKSQDTELNKEALRFFLVAQDIARTRYMLEVVLSEEGEWEPSKLHFVENLPTA